MSWRTGLLLREARLNLQTGAIRVAVAGSTVFAVLLSVALLELRDADDLLRFQQAYSQAGGYVAVVRDPSGGALDAARCEALGDLDAVVAAGSLGAPYLTTFTTAPGTIFRRADITRGALEVWAPGQPVPVTPAMGLIAGAGLGEELGLVAGSFVQPEGEAPLPIVAVLDTTDRNGQVARWAMSVKPPVGEASECWVEFRRRTYDGGIAMLPAWFSEGDEPAVANPYRRSDEFARDPEAEFAGRPQRSGWPIAAALIVAMNWLMTWFRRSELGLYLALGTPRIGTLFLLAAESWLLVVPTAVAALTYALALGHALGWEPGLDEAMLAVRTMGAVALFALFLMPLAPLILVRGTIAELLKDR